MRKIDKQFDEYIDYCENILMLSPFTIQSKRWFVSEMLKEVTVSSLEELSNDDINKWIMIQSKRGVSGNTINDRLSHLKAALKYFHAIGVSTPNLNMILIPKIPKVPPKRKYYSEEQIKRVLSMAKPFEWLLISLSYDCGLRIGELRNLRLENIDGQRIAFVGKGRKQREVYISQETKKRLDLLTIYGLEKGLRIKRLLSLLKE